MNGRPLMNKKLGRLEKICYMICAIYLVAAGLFYYAAAVGWDMQGAEVKLMDPGANLGVLVGDTVIEQRIIPKTQTIDRIAPYLGVLGDVQGKEITVELLQANQVLGSRTVDLSGLGTEQFRDISFSASVKVAQNEEAVVRITLKGLTAENAVTVYYGNGVATARGLISLEGDMRFTVNGEPVQGALAMKVIGRSYFHMSRIYLMIAAGIFVLLVAALVWQVRKYRSGKRSFIIQIALVLDKYRYLMKQMVSRDFNVKYKRSVLGVIWSFLNPLLTMLVQYFVFAGLFKNNVDNFLVYLLTGIVTFSYFNEAASMGLNAIVGNASLITKVYVPKFIYAVVPVLSATINMLFSLIPLIVIMLINGIAFTKALLLLPVGILFIMTFSIGMSLILSTSMVFFRDTKFLWGVISMLWNFLTPIFYSEAIIPARFIGLYRMNPMYQFVYFMRTIIIGGVSPNPMTYLYCTAAAVGTLLVGLYLFRRNQDKFVFNL